MARSVGLEPTTSASAGLRSNQTELRARTLVPKGGFEPPRPFRALRPERSASAVPPLRLLEWWAVQGLSLRPVACQATAQTLCHCTIGHERNRLSYDRQPSAGSGPKDSPVSAATIRKTDSSCCPAAFWADGSFSPSKRQALGAQLDTVSIFLRILVSLAQGEAA